MSFSVPVLLIAFNRPESTSRVLEVLRQLQPERLYVACDGPRSNHPVEIARIEEVRDMLQYSPAGLVDWPCQLHQQFLVSNLGCRDAVVAGIDWFFDQESEGIILEDDIIPDLSFFAFCEELLRRYRLDSRVGSICANNHQRVPPVDGSSYRFSIYSHGWGWATWRRAWRCYDRNLSGWPSFREGGWLQQLGGRQFSRIWGRWLEDLAQGKVNSVWDMIWQLSFWEQGFLAVIPAVELVENIGFDADATHTLDQASPLGPRGQMTMPLVHPRIIQADRQRDADTFRRLYRRTPWGELQRKVRKARRLVLGA